MGVTAQGAPVFTIGGDPDGISTRAAVMMDRANEFEEIHSSLISLNSDGWTGRAADHFREKFKIQIQGWADAQEAFSSASQAYSSYASTLQSAQSQCDEIRSRWQQGQQAVEQAQNNKADARSQAQAEGGIPMFDASCDEGPGRATMQGAEDDFQALVDGVNASGTALIAALDAGIAKLPERTWGDAAWRTAGSILLGLYEGVEALGKLMMLGLPDLSADLGRLWRGEITPAEFQAKYVDIPLNTISTIASGIANDPGKFFTELGKSLVDWDTWADDPGRAFGRIIPDIVITIATAGAAAGAKGLTGGARFAYVGREVFLQVTHISDVQDIAHLSRALVNKIGKAGSHIASSVADAMSHLSHATPTPHTHVTDGVSHPTSASGAHSKPNAGTPTHPSHGVAGPSNSSTPNIAPGHQPNGVSSTAQPGIGPHTSGATNANVSTNTAAGNPTASTHTPVGAPANPYAHTNEAPMPDSGIRKNSDSANFSSSNSNQVNNGDFTRSANSNWQHSNGISEGHTGGVGKNNSSAGPAGSQTPFNTTPHTEGATAYSKPNHADAYAQHDQLNTSAGRNEIKLSDQRSNDLVGSFAGSSNAHHPGSTANNIGGGVSASPHASHSNGMPAGQQGGGFSSSTPGTHGNSSIPSQGTPSSPGSSTHTSSGTTPYSGYGNPHQGTYGPGNHQGAPSSAQPASGAAPAHNTDGSSPVHPKSDTPIPAPPKSDTPIPAPPKVDASNAHTPGQTHHAGHTTPETTHGADTHTQKADGTTGIPTTKNKFAELLGDPNTNGTNHAPDGKPHTADPTSHTHEADGSADVSTGNKYKDKYGSAEPDDAAHPTTSEDDLKNKSLYDILSEMESSHAHHSTPDAPHATHAGADGATDASHAGHGDGASPTADGKPHAADPSTPTHEADGSADVSTGNKYKDKYGSAEPDDAAHPTTSEDDLKNKSLYDILSEMESSHAHHSTPDAPHATHAGADGATDASHAGHGDGASPTADGKPHEADPTTPTHEADGATDAPATKNKFDELLGNPKTDGTTHAPNGTSHAADPTTPTHTTDGSADVSTGNKYKDKYGSSESDGSGHTTDPEGIHNKNPHHDPHDGYKSSHANDSTADASNGHDSVDELTDPHNKSNHKGDDTPHGDNSSTTPGKDPSAEEPLESSKQNSSPDNEAADNASVNETIADEATDTAHTDGETSTKNRNWENAPEAPYIYTEKGMDQWATEFNAEWPEVTKKQLLTTNDYTTDNFEHYNAFARDPSADVAPKFKEGVSEINDFLRVSPHHEGVVYRGAKLPKEVLNKVLETRVFKDPGILSTSMHEHIARSFAKKHILQPDEASVILEIHSKKGTDIRRVSQNPHEGEVLFPILSEFDVTDVTVDPDTGLPRLILSDPD